MRVLACVGLVGVEQAVAALGAPVVVTLLLTAAAALAAWWALGVLRGGSVQ